MKNIVLVAHDSKKAEMLEWASTHIETLKKFKIFATGTTGTILEQELQIPIEKLMSGPLGGDQQIGAKISEGIIDILIFFWDPLSPQPHDSDVKALLRIANVWNIPIACNEASANLLITSPLLTDVQYTRRIPDFSDYQQRNIKI
ncbi:methylglyoxal synthase [bacterium 336/3]|nr:methylglyoxal synthase [bacterium 336/3]